MVRERMFSDVDGRYIIHDLAMMTGRHQFRPPYFMFTIALMNGIKDAY